MTRHVSVLQLRFHVVKGTVAVFRLLGHSISEFVAWCELAIVRAVTCVECVEVPLEVAFALLCCLSCAPRLRAVARVEVGRCFAGRRNIFGAGFPQDFFCGAGPLGVIAVHRYEDMPAPNASFVAFYLILRYPGPNQCPGQTAHRRAYACSAQQCHNWTRGDERT